MDAHVEVVARDGQNVAIVHDRLRQEIISGRVPAGQVSQVTLARQLDVGRTPLREALRMLQREGLVISEPNRQVRIAELSTTDAEELYVMRVALEGVAARLTVPMLGSDGIAELEGLIAQMDHYMRVGDGDGFRTPHRAFHARLVAGAGARVARTISELFDHAERYRATFGGPTQELWDQRTVEHRGIVDAATAGDADLIVRCLLEHYGRTAALIFTGLGDDYDPERLRTAIATMAPGAERSLSD